MSRVDEELGLLRAWWPSLEYNPADRWVLLRGFRLTRGVWSAEVVDVAFQIPARLPAEAPYGFYVRPGLRLAGGALPSNYVEEGSGPPFGPGPWGKFSWAAIAWCPTVDARAGDNMVGFATSITDRLKEAS
jgi:hypothetical protein